MNVYFCPVCWKRAVRNKTHDVIWPHLDSIGAEECPASNHPYRIAIRAALSPRTTLRQAVSAAHQLLEAIAA